MSAAVVRKSARAIQIRMFECPECGAVVPATKTRFKTKVGHIKTMYCYRCRKATDHIQLE